MARHKARLLKNGRNAGSTAFVMLDNYSIARHIEG
jgi:hypothetical protein